VDHLVIPLDRDHIQALAALACGVAAAANVGVAAACVDPHVTVVAYTGLSRKKARASIENVAGETEPFVLHAHGYGFFTGDEFSELSLHVPVVRTGALDAVHRRFRAALQRGGAAIAGWSEPELWSPHITLLDRGLDPTSLAATIGWLAHRRHPSWRIPVDRVVVTGGRRDRVRPGDIVPFGASAAQQRREVRVTRRSRARGSPATPS
jgi:2'-5' RNA ligase